MSSRPSTVAASRNTRSRSYQYTDHPRASAAVARASRYMTESAMVCARWSAIRSSIVGGSLGHARIAMPATGTGTAAASASRFSRAPRAARRGRSHPLDEGHGVRERKRPRSGGVQVTTHRPRPFVVMRVRRQTAIGERDVPAIEEFAAGRDSDEHRRVPVLGDADGRFPLRSSSRHIFLLR
jgi:hypothetical protein